MKAPEFCENFPNLVKLIITLIKNDPHLGPAKQACYRKEKIADRADTCCA